MNNFSVLEIVDIMSVVRSPMCTLYFTKFIYFFYLLLELLLKLLLKLLLILELLLVCCK
jgi:hypothetical protein